MKIFITGVSSGLGICLAKEFLACGDEVWGIGRRKFDLEGIDINPQQNLRYYQCDTTKDSQVQNTFEEMVKADYIPDIAIFCAGSAIDDIAEDNFRLDRFKENFSVNLFGILCWVELLLSYYLKRNKGVFAGISSMSVYRESRKDRIGYSASRIALNKTFENLHLEYLDTGVEFVIFNMGRMKERSGIIGTSYSKAAYTIVKMLKSGKHSKLVNIPFSQYLLTRMVQFIPEKIFKNYLMKE